MSAIEPTTTAAGSGTNKSNQRSNLAFVVGSCMENTSAHGISNIKRANHPIRRLVWVCAFLASFGACILLVSKLFIAFYKRDITTNVDVQSATSLQFPAVTICNNNGMLKSYLKKHSELYNSINETADKLDVKFQAWDNTDPERHEAVFDLINILTEHLSPVLYNDREASGHKISTALLTCNFKGIPCLPSDFSYTYNYLYGNCYTFNDGRAQETSNITNAGPLYGLTVEMNIEQSEYIADMRPAAGLRILVHDQAEMPFPEDQGTNVSPGRETSIGIYRTVFQRLPNPYPSDCQDNESVSTLFSRKFPKIAYSKQACMKDCVYNKTFEACNCYSPRYTYDSEKPICTVHVETEEECQINVTDKIALGEIKCQCGPACNEILYKTNVFSSEWPGTEYMAKAVTKLVNTPNISYEGNDTEAFIKRNFAKVNIYYENLQYDSITQVATYTSLSLVSNVGGYLGLWIGMSALTLLEFLECFYDILKHGFAMLFEKKEKVNKTSAESNPPRVALFQNDVFAK